MREPVNPPYDGKPCLACDPVFGYEFAYLYNALNRLKRMEPKMMEHLSYLKTDHPTLNQPSEMFREHPLVLAYQELFRKVQEALNGMHVDGRTIRWLPGTMQRLKHLETEWIDVLAELELAKELHREDKRHCSGGVNTLRAAAGGKSLLWGRRSREEIDYNHFVVVAPGEGHPPSRYESKWSEAMTRDLRHTVCGAQFAIADYFKEHIRRDPAFYARFECRVCRVVAPWSQMEVLFD